MYLGIEIGGTKLQLGVGRGDGPPLVELVRLDARPELGAEGIRRQLAEHGRPLVERHRVRAVGFGFGGPVDTAQGKTLVSHQVEGWKDFALGRWCQETLGVPALVANDSDSAGLAEARFGAGRGRRVVFYTNVGSGIGGALVLDGHLYPGGAGVASEIGHLRPGLDAEKPDATVESFASGWAISRYVAERLKNATDADVGRTILSVTSSETDRIVRPTDSETDWIVRPTIAATNDSPGLSTALIARAAVSGNAIAREAFDRACRVYGWAVAQMITLLAPNVVVLGGGVSLAPEAIWRTPLARYIDRYVFPPLLGSFALEPARLGEEVVVHGALALAREAFDDHPRAG